MNGHAFQMRLTCRYQPPRNSVGELKVENLVKGEWQDFELNFSQPGFLIFVYGILNCQHLYMRVNAHERGLVLSSAVGSVEVLSDEQWVLQRLQVNFEAQLASGAPSREDVDYIIARMQHCPVSVNLREVADSGIRVEFVSVP